MKDEDREVENQKKIRKNWRGEDGFLKIDGWWMVDGRWEIGVI